MNRSVAPGEISSNVVDEPGSSGGGLLSDLRLVLGRTTPFLQLTVDEPGTAPDEWDEMRGGDPARQRTAEQVGARTRPAPQTSGLPWRKWMHR